MSAVEALHQLLMSPWLWAGVAVLVLIKILRLPKVKGRLGEWWVIRFGLKRLDRRHYCHFSDLYLPCPDGTGTTQIDHVVV